MNRESIIILLIVCCLILYKLYDMFGYWFIPNHPHKINSTVEEYYEHIKEYHPDIWKEHNLTDEGIKELKKRMSERENALRNNENES